MFGSLILVFREVLEAALIVSIVAAATRGVAHRSRWIAGGIALGVVGASILAIFTGAISESLSGMGQEWFNASVLLAAVLMIGWHVVWMARHGRELAAQMKAIGNHVSTGERSLTVLMMIVAIAVLREGSEVVLFTYGLHASGSSLGALALGGLLGLLAGVLVGITLYFGLLKIPMKHFFSATNALLILLASGLAASAAGYLIQADVLPSLVNPLWNSSWLLSDQSVLGQLLHVLIGYSASPTGMQAIFYVVTLVVLVLGMQFFSKTTLPITQTATLNP
jgi:high-affinity iron transporter